MKISSLVARAFRGLKTARVRTLLTALAIAVGGFVLTLTLAASNGARQYADSIIDKNTTTNSLTVSKTDFSSVESFTKPQKYDPNTSADATPLQYLSQKDVTRIKQYDFVESVSEMYSISPRYIAFGMGGGEERYKATLSGDNQIERPELAAGTVSGALSRGQMIVADAYREALGLKNPADLVGKQVRVVVESPLVVANPDTPPLEKVFTVVGVSKSGGFSANPLAISIDNQSAAEMNDFATKNTPAFGKFLSVNITIKNGDDEAVMREAQQRLKDDGFASQGAADAQKMASQIINVLQGIVFGFGAITLIASVFGVVNTMYISVLERTREIGLMKALGMSRRSLKWLFRIEAAWIGMLGGLIGSLLGWGAGAVLNPVIKNALDIDQYLLVFPLGQILLMIGALMLVAMLAGMLPARKAAKLDPVEALRTE